MMSALGSNVVVGGLQSGCQTAKRNLKFRSAARPGLYRSQKPLQSILPNISSRKDAPLNASLPRGRTLVGAGGGQSGGGGRRQQQQQEQQQRDRELAKQTRQDDFIIYGGALTLFALVYLAAKLDVVDVSWDGIGGFSAGDLTGAVLWGISFYFVSPLQLLLLFLGRIETERPSDWALRQFGLASGFDVDAIDYTAPLPLRLATVSLCAVGGFATSILLSASLGDATWAVSTGIGALFAAALYEVGRPERLSVEELVALEKQWQDFAEFADDALVRRGRCFETEIFQSFRRRFGRYRTQETLTDARIRQMIKNWEPRVERSSSGWYRGISLAGSTADVAAATRQPTLSRSSSSSSIDSSSGSDGESSSTGS